jgi:tetratricopeptide (TPR) repeat protein/nucleoside 2-deoxyribosyltransferase
MHAYSADRPLNVEEAYERLDDYGRRYGRLPLLLLLHAAVPETLRPELLNLLKVNFLALEAGSDMTVEADVLLSPMIHRAAGEYYRIDAEVRRHSLQLLDAVYRDEPERRTVRVSRFLLAYADALEKNLIGSPDPLLAEYLAVQRWAALAFVDPLRAAEEFARAVEAVAQPESIAARLRLGSILSAVSIPLAGQPQLLAYARAVDALHAGEDEDSARRLLEGLGDELTVGGITLRPRAVRERFTPVRETDWSAPGPSKPVCRILMAFGTRTDARQNKSFDLEKSYSLLIKPAVEAAGYICERADEMEGINARKYENLLRADLVIADLSTRDLQTVFELGIRCGLRPSGIVTIAENNFQAPELGHLKIRRYEHLGSDIGFDEVPRFRNLLIDELKLKLTETIVDSPVYVFLPDLKPPSLIRPTDEPRSASHTVVASNQQSGSDKVVTPGQRQSKEGAAKDRMSCFVIIGFGEKTDFQSQRVLNLDKTYNYLIKPVVEEAGLACVRADEIMHSTVIDKPIYENLLSADLVIADLSTGNLGVLFELGVRYALRPKSTILMAESNFSFPFDPNYLSILRYEHLGKDLPFDEVMRARGALKDRIVTLIDRQETDSPVYALLPNLLPPSLPEERKWPDETLELKSSNIQLALAAGQRGDFITMRDTLLLVRAAQGQSPDAFVLQQLALATFKAQEPDPRTALLEARKVLLPLNPEKSQDPQTLGLWAAINRRLFRVSDLQSERREALDAAINAYQKSFAFNHDYHNGINWACLLTERASRASGEDAATDRTDARRVFEQVLDICQGLLSQAVRRENEKALRDEEYWIRATIAEALMGLGRVQDALKAFADAEEVAPESWMIKAVEDRLTQLAKLLRAVLILGRFTDKRKAVLDALREELRKRNYLPILFDFAPSAARDITETVSLLARMARFIIADLTDPSSVPKELEAIIPGLAVPVQPLLEGASRPYAMFKDYSKYDWVLPVYRYDGLEPLLATLAEKVIAPAEGKVKDLEERQRKIEAELTKPQ